MSKVALYVRVSTEKQTNENQILQLTDYAKAKGFDYEIFQEVESSRKTRPVKADLLGRLRAGEYESVVVWRLDRWARSTVELLLEIQELLQKKIGFISLSDNVDFNSAMGQLHLTILAGFANFERSLISERTKEGLLRARSQGKFAGRPKGSKDAKPRKKSGYILRQAQTRKNTDEKNGIHQAIDVYINNPPVNN
jgi:putative DNA-invertase from lambdoid prophage Rac